MLDAGLSTGMLMSEDFSRRAFSLTMGAAIVAAASEANAAPRGSYSEDDIGQAASRFFGAGAQGLSTVIHHIFNDNGRPVGYMEGTEGSGAIGIGLRYGDGRMHLHGEGGSYKVYWRGPSVGFDTGGNAAKVFTLIYGLNSAGQIYQRFPGVEGSAYFVGGVGVNYQRSGHVTLAPMRAGVGFRLGANIGYLAYSRRRVIEPF
jgi:hypothetical protein